LTWEARHVQRLEPRNAVKAAKPRLADHIVGPGGRVHEFEENEGDDERDNAEIDVAKPAVEHHRAEHRGKERRDQDGDQHRDRALADIDRGDGVSIGAKAEEGSLPKTENAAKAPDEAEAHRQHAVDEKGGQHEAVEKLRQEEHQRRRDAKRDEETLHRNLTHYIFPRKKRAVIPCGSRRSRMTAETSSAASPTTGERAKVNSWLTAPKTVPLLISPVMTEGPPAITVMKAFAI